MKNNILEDEYTEPDEPAWIEDVEGDDEDGADEADSQE